MRICKILRGFNKNLQDPRGILIDFGDFRGFAKAGEDFQRPERFLDCLASLGPSGFYWILLISLDFSWFWTGPARGLGEREPMDFDPISTKKLRWI